MGGTPLHDPRNPLADGMRERPPIASGGDSAEPLRSSVTHHTLLGTVNELVSAELSPQGSLDIESADAFRQMSAHLLGLGIKQFYVDLGNLDYMDSTGLGSMLQLYREAKAKGGVMRIYNPTPPIQDIFTVTHLDKVLKIYRTRQEAFSEAGTA